MNPLIIAFVAEVVTEMVLDAIFDEEDWYGYWCVSSWRSDDKKTYKKKVN